jgi:hypothetical protein
MVKVTEESLVWRTPCGVSEEAQLQISVIDGGKESLYNASMIGNGRYMAEFPAVRGWEAGGKKVFSGHADRIIVSDDEGVTLEVAIAGDWSIYARGYSLVFVR